MMNCCPGSLPHMSLGAGCCASDGIMKVCLISNTILVDLGVFCIGCTNIDVMVTTAHRFRDDRLAKMSRHLFLLYASSLGRKT